MTSQERRKQILGLIQDSDIPLTGSELGRITGVSRQVVVQDIALLRTEGHDIVSTARGYVLYQLAGHSRVFKVIHTNEQTETELNAIVDLGGVVEDVMVNHRIYGKMTAPLNIRSRRDVQNFMHNIRTGKSSPLMTVTSGYHFHKITAPSPEILDEIHELLGQKGYLAELTPYEEETLE